MGSRFVAFVVIGVIPHCEEANPWFIGLRQRGLAAIARTRNPKPVMDDDSVGHMDRWMQTWWGIAVRILFAVSGFAVGGLLGFLAAGVLLFTTLLEGEWPFENLTVPTGFVSAMALAAGFCVATTLAAALRPTRKMAILGGVGLVGATALLIFVFGLG